MQQFRQYAETLVAMGGQKLGKTKDKKMRLVILILLLTFSVQSFGQSNQNYDWIQMILYINYDDPDGVVELFRYEYSYDAEGREIETKTSSKGILLNQTRDYQYDGLTVTYWTDYPKSSQSTKSQKTYYDKNWLQLTQYIQFDTDSVTEILRTEQSYDAEGKEIGGKLYRNGILISQAIDYQYNDRVATYWYENYSKGRWQSQKSQYTYSDKNWIQATQSIEYAADGITEKHRHEYSYDAEGREIGYRKYFNGILQVQNRDYQYDGRTVTYLEDYFEGSMRYTTKQYKVFRDKNEENGN